MKFLLLLLLTLSFGFQSFSQRKSRADRFFENGDYLNAITYYQKELDNYKHTKSNVQNIAISYYNTFQFRKAYRYLSYVVKGKFKGKDKSYENHFNFKLYHVLSALGEYDKALPFLELYHKNKKIKPQNRNEAIATIEEFKLKDDDFTIVSSKLNTDSAEFGAIKRDSTIYLTSDRSLNKILNKKYKWTHRPFLDIFQVKVDSLNTPIGEFSSISEKINGRLHEGNFCFSKDGNTLYFSRSNYERGKKKFDSIRSNAIQLYKSVKDDSLKVWSKPKKLPFNDVSYSTEHPALSPDGKKLYFSSNRPGGYGEFDLYAVIIENDSTYSVPKNLGKKINTVNREQFPFITQNGDLYFASNGHFGLGMLDIFACENSNGEFDKPINLGAPVNSRFDDFSLSYYNETEGFFTSNRNKTNDDIYQFSKIGTIFPEPLIVNFEVRDLISKEFVPNAVVALQNRDKKVIYEKQLDSLGAFKTEILPGRYDLEASAENYDSKAKPFLIKDSKNQTYTIYLTKKEPVVVEVVPLTLKEQLLEDKEGPPIVEKEGKLFFEVPPIYFDFDKWNIREDSKKVLDELGLKLEKYPTIAIKISSHTDSRGTKAYNQILSERRAESTRNYLALVGFVNARRLSYEGFGEYQPLIDCGEKICTEDEHQINRRSEFEIVKF